MLKVRSVIELCGLRMSMEMYIASKGFYSARATSSLAIHSITADMHPGLLLVVRLTVPGNVLSQNSRLNAAAVGEITQPTTRTM